MREAVSEMEFRLLPELEKKFLILKDNLRDRLREGLVVAFSGGVDSAFLLWTANEIRQESGGRLVALTALSESMPEVEQQDARKFARNLGVEHVWEPSKELSNPAYARNDSDRCYHCKSELFRICHEVATQFRARWLAYGYNASDMSDFRPGHRAALEKEVISPLADAELKKEEIRTLVRAHGLAFWDKPASPCLSSRLMHGVTVTRGKLRDVESIESILRNAGLRVFRVRMHELDGQGFLRIEVEPREICKALEIRDALVREGQKRGYRWVTLDLAGYRMGGGVL